jgi:hypothetical protein
MLESCSFPEMRECENITIGFSSKRNLAFSSNAAPSPLQIVWMTIKGSSHILLARRSALHLSADQNLFSIEGIRRWEYVPSRE